MSSLNVEVPCDERAPAEVRDALREQLGAAAGPVVGDAMLLASEIVTNAVRHSGCDPEDPLHVRVEIGDGLLRLEVADPARGASAPELPDPDDLTAGVGLRIVEALAERWGTTTGSGRVVWAELTLV